MDPMKSYTVTQIVGKAQKISYMKESLQELWRYKIHLHIEGNLVHKNLVSGGTGTKSGSSTVISKRLTATSWESCSSQKLEIQEYVLELTQAKKKTSND